MGNKDEDHPKKRRIQLSPQTKTKLKVLTLVLVTNLLTLYIFTPSDFQPISKYTQNLSIPLWDSTTLFHQLNSTQHELAASHSQISDLRQELDKLLAQLTSARKSEMTSHDDELVNLSDEVKLSITPHKLPLGVSPTTGLEDVNPPVGGGCLKFPEELTQYMSYDIGGECPVDNNFAQRFMLRGCEPLPRRRCRPKTPSGYVEPNHLPESLWATPSDKSIIWDPYKCKSYQCLEERGKNPGIYDCKDCFHLKGRESTRWLTDGGLKFGMDQVLGMKSAGSIRIGLDIGGGSGSFAARMKERNITIVTTTMNFDGPFNSFIASRGLIPMHVSVHQRLPFFENTLDIVHSMHVLSNWIPDTMLEFTLYDIFRVLRPGGLFWLDHFFCFRPQLNETYVPMLDRVGFKRLRWNAGMKLDRRKDGHEWYFSAVLEKPMT